MKEYAIVTDGYKLYISDKNLKYWAGPRYFVGIRLDQAKEDFAEWMRPHPKSTRWGNYIQFNRIIGDIIGMSKLLVSNQGICLKKGFVTDAPREDIFISRLFSKRMPGIYFPSKQVLHHANGEYSAVYAQNMVDLNYKPIVESVEYIAMARALEIVGIPARTRK